MKIKNIKIDNYNISIKELSNLKNRFPAEFYKIYSHNISFKEKKIYKIITKNTIENKIITNIILVNNITNLSNETIIEILENYKNKDIIFTDEYGVEHDIFYNMLGGIDNLYFNWHKNKFFYTNGKSGPHYVNSHEKLKLIFYLKLKNDPFSPTPDISTPNLNELEEESSYFPK